MKKRIAKKVLAGVLSCVMILSFVACDSNTDSASKLQNGNSVEEAMNQQMEKEDAAKTTEELPETLVVPPTESSSEQGGVEKIDEAAAEELFGKGNDYDPKATTEATTESGATSIEDAKTDVDVDLTVMNSNMVYSTVYQMMADAPSYVGKTVRMKGSYYSTYDETTDTRYFYIIVKDATACCQQGLEFVWGDGTHKFPDEYPEDGTEAVVSGTFETYKDNPDDVYEYIHLVNASFEVVDAPTN